MKHKDKWLPITVMMLILGLVMGFFMWVKTLNTKLIQPVIDVAGE